MDDPARDSATAPRLPRPGRGAAAAPRLRPATGSDARALCALMEGVYAEGRWFVGDGAPRPDMLARRLRSLDPGREIVLVAELPEDDVNGAAPLGPRRGWRPVGWIEAHRYAPASMEHIATFTLAVRAGARGRGVGRALLRGILPWARRAGVRKLRLDVRADNRVARALYESEGFEVEGIERRQILRRPAGGPGASDAGPPADLSDDAYEDNVIMARFL